MCTRRRNLAGLAMDCLAYEAARLGKIDFLKNGFNISEVLYQKNNPAERQSSSHCHEFRAGGVCQRGHTLESRALSEANMKGDTPLHTASRTGCPRMVELFISCSEALCDDIENAPRNLLRMVNQEGDTALHVAVRNGHLDTALHAAVKYDHLDVVKLLVKADIELLHMDNKANESPLYLAVERGLFDFTKYMLNKCPKCSHRGTKGLTALACGRGSNPSR
ncbi:hypothetical protein CK203_050309 [Vitis vinifera]|uniref:Uncharacterized protein n=1 Tax=Vitis vinifera TaxID=29760 RepID=A0A438GZQ4_VITVI|nr:hypothetical protein CK203_050309 [Vitis vinifera]